MSDSFSQAWLDFPYGTRFDLVGTTSVGRAPDNTLVLNDNEVSRRHALIQAQDDGEFWLVDLGSANGSYVNDRRISQPVELRSGDVIQISGVKMSFGTARVKADESSSEGSMASTMMSIRQAQCWMMIVDIIGSTALAQEIPAEEWPRVTGTWFKTCREVIEANGGHMMKYLGDGFFCYWIAEDCATEQVRETLINLMTMQQAASPPFRVVVHHGSAVLGSVPTMAELNLHGAEVNFTFRIEKLAGSFRQEVMLSEMANFELGMTTQFVARAKVEGFDGSYSFFGPEG